MRFQEQYLFDRLKHLSGEDVYPFHMPGHKRNMEGYPLEELYQLDITEIDDFDNLHRPEDILFRLQEKISSVYHTKASFCLVNGSSCGVLSAIAACLTRGSSLLLARGSHQSAYHAVYQEELSAVYLYPQYVEEFDLYGAIPPEQVEQALARRPDIGAVFITSPTYEGIFSPIAEIARIAHAKGAVLIVDEAHGAHLRFTGQEQYSAVEQGADIVIQSIHKTLPAPTQTALLHLCSDRVNAERVRRYLRIYQSSSPSYVLLTGIDECFRILEREADDRRAAFWKRHGDFMERMRALRRIRLLSAGVDSGGDATDAWICQDMGKMVISVQNTDMSGRQLYDVLLNQYHLQMEMAADSYVLAILTLMDTQEGFERLAQALLAIDRELQRAGGREESDGGNGNRRAAETGNRLSADDHAAPASECPCSHGEAAAPPLTVYDAMQRERESVSLAECEGRTAAEYVMLYPPGSPLIVPGERYTKELVRRIQSSLAGGLCVQGTGPENDVFVIKE